MHPRELRQKTPHQTWSVRALRTPDGITRLITHQQAYWDTLDWLEKQGFRTKAQIIAISWEGACTDSEMGKTPERVFNAYLTMAIYQYSYWLRQERDGLANENNEPWLEHGPAQRGYPRPLIFPEISCASPTPRIRSLADVRPFMPAYRFDERS